MKILQVIPFFYPVVTGGVTYTVNLSQNLIRRGHQADIMTINTENAEREGIIAGNIRVYRCALDFSWGKAAISSELYRKLCQAKGYDVYHIHIPFALGLEAAIIASKANHIPLVATHHGEMQTGDRVNSMAARMYNNLTRYVTLGWVDRLIFLTKSYSESLPMSTRTRNKISIVRMGIDVNSFSPANDGSGLRQQYGFDKDTRVVLFVGALDKDHRPKNVDYLIRAIRQVKSKNGHTKLVIIGGGGLIPEFEKLASDLDMKQDILFTGSVPYEKLPTYYAMCDIFVLPSSIESFGLVIQEAMASGKPCIACDLPGIKDSIINEKMGLKVPPKNEEALANAILHLLANDNLRLEMGMKAREYVEEFSIAKFIDKMEGIYTEVTK
ncbi:MAG: glycosyltransferase family 4 protein [Dehalococcoidia bacterium]